MTALPAAYFDLAFEFYGLSMKSSNSAQNSTQIGEGFL